MIQTNWKAQTEMSFSKKIEFSKSWSNYHFLLEMKKGLHLNKYRSQSLGSIFWKTLEFHQRIFTESLSSPLWEGKALHDIKSESPHYRTLFGLVKICTVFKKDIKKGHIIWAESSSEHFWWSTIGGQSFVRLSKNFTFLSSST